MKVQKFLHAAFRHFGDKHVWMTGVGPILEKMDGSDDSFEAALQELCTYMCGPDGKTGVDAVDLYTLSDGQRHPEGTYELTLDGKLLLDADGKPRKIPRKKSRWMPRGSALIMQTSHGSSKKKKSFMASAPLEKDNAFPLSRVVVWYSK